MQRITASFNVYDIDNNNLSGIEVWVEGKRQGTTNQYGRITVQLDELEKRVAVKFIDPKELYKDKIETYTFKESKANRNVQLYLNPVDLVVNVSWASGAPAVGEVEIEPAPDPSKGRTKFTLKAGEAQIKVYRKGDYLIRYTTTAGPIVSDSRNVRILMDSNRLFYESFTIPDASLRVLIDAATPVNVKVYKVAEKRDEFIGTIAGNGKSSLDVSNYGYGDIKFIFTRPGWTIESEEVKRLKRPNQLFYFVIKGHYKRCKELEARKEWQEACKECEQVQLGDPNYCDALTTLMEVYRKELSEYDLAIDAIREYIDNSNGTCEKNWSYYPVLFDLLSKLNKIPDNITNERKLETYYDDFNILVTLQVGQNNKKKKNTVIKNVNESMAKITLLRINKNLEEWKKNKFDEALRDHLKSYSEDLFSDLNLEYLNGLDASEASVYRIQGDGILKQMQ